MAEENKGASCCCGGKGFATLSKLIVGIILVALGVFLCVRWWLPLRLLIQGCLGPVLILMGLVFLAIAKE